MLTLILLLIHDTELAHSVAPYAEMGHSESSLRRKSAHSSTAFSAVAARLHAGRSS